MQVTIAKEVRIPAIKKDLTSGIPNDLEKSVNDSVLPLFPFSSDNYFTVLAIFFSRESSTAAEFTLVVNTGTFA